MDFETERICLNQIIEEKSDVFSVDENIIIPDIKPDILSTINSCGNIYVYKKEIINGKIKIDGGVQVYVMYIADDEQNSVRGLHTVVDFSQTIDADNLKDDMSMSCNLSIKGIECKILNGRKVNVKVNVAVGVSIFSNTEKHLIKSIKDNDKVQMISSEMEINSLKGKGETIALAKDTISVDDNIVDILNTDITIKNTDLKISYNKVLTKADVVVEILYLNDEEKINSTVTNIPIMGFIDISDVADTDICDTNYEIRNISVRPSNTDDQTISVEIEFLIACASYETKSINMIQDLYSPEKDISLSQESICLMQNRNIMADECKVQERLNIADLKDSRIYSIKIIPNIVKQSVSNNTITYEIEAELNILYESNSTGRIEVKKQNIPITHTVSSEKIDKNAEVFTEVETLSKDFMCMDNNDIEINIVLKFMLDTFTRKNINIVNNINVEDFRSDERQNSLVIYFIKEGDTLWKIAKRFRTTIDEITQINNIEDVDKLNVGEQLYIPRYECKRIS